MNLNCFICHVLGLQASTTIPGFIFIFIIYLLAQVYNFGTAKYINMYFIVCILSYFIGSFQDNFFMLESLIQLFFIFDMWCESGFYWSSKPLYHTLRFNMSGGTFLPQKCTLFLLNLYQCLIVLIDDLSFQVNLDYQVSLYILEGLFIFFLYFNVSLSKPLIEIMFMNWNLYYIRVFLPINRGYSLIWIFFLQVF